MKGKRRAQQRHARVRAQERYGLEFGPATREAVLRAIQTGRSEHVAKQSHRVSVHDVEVDGATVRVVYDRQRKEVVTFLRPEWEVG